MEASASTEGDAVISDELRAEIRRLYYGEHWKIGTIVAQLGVHADTVKKAIAHALFVNVEYRPRAMLLDPYKGFVREVLAQHPKLVSTRILEMVRSRGYAGSVWPVQRYVKGVRPGQSHEAFFRLTTLPGEEGQVDWGCFGKVLIGRSERALSCFVMVLSWSRALYAHFVLDQTLESFLRCHVGAFTWFGGVPRALLYDNLKTAVVERMGDVIRFHPKMLELAGHHHFLPKPVAVARGNEKGRVERSIRYLRESFFAGRAFHDVADLNAQLGVFLNETSMARKVPRDSEERTVREAFEEEKARLLPLPKNAFFCDYTAAIQSGKTPYVRFDTNDYSIPYTHVRKPLTLLASDTHVSLLDGTLELAKHKRCWERGKQLEIEAHLEGLSEAKRHAKEGRGKNRVFANCASGEAFLNAVALNGGHLGGTTARLIRLLDTHGKDRLEEALATALKRGAANAHSVAHILDKDRQKRGEPVPLDPILAEDPRVSGLRVEPRDFAAYDTATAGIPTKETP